MTEPNREEAARLNRLDELELEPLLTRIDSTARSLASDLEQCRNIKQRQAARTAAAGLPGASAYNLDDVAGVLHWILRHLPGVPEAKPQYREQTVPHVEASARATRQAA